MFIPASPPFPCARTLLLTTNHLQTEAPLQLSWGNFEYSGRVRVSDGLVVLVRQSVGLHPVICFSQ
jgi:hypothetical protein